MRTTVNLAEDVFYAVKEKARREGRSAGDVLSDLVRKALTGSVGVDVSAAESFYGFHPLPRRGAVVTNELIDRLREELGD